MQTVIHLGQVFHPDIIRIIFAAILFIPFIYLLTLKEEKEEEIVKHETTPTRSELYQAMYSQLASEAKPIVEMKQADLAV
jgi:hypothetical protein